MFKFSKRKGNSKADLGVRHGDIALDFKFAIRRDFNGGAGGETCEAVGGQGDQGEVGEQGCEDEGQRGNVRRAHSGADLTFISLIRDTTTLSWATAP